MTKCGRKCEVYSRVVGYYRPTSHWNKGKKEEYKDRVEYSVIKSLKSKFGRTLDTFKSEDINEELNVSIEESVVLTIQNAKKH
tara:strand:- start:1246 stop:1494 length:249 start_codon:yes stop_codon:yes gene_type:complete